MALLELADQQHPRNGVQNVRSTRKQHAVGPLVVVEHLVTVVLQRARLVMQSEELVDVELHILCPTFLDKLFGHIALFEEAAKLLDDLFSMFGLGIDNLN